MLSTLCPEEKSLFYAKYMDLPMDPLDDTVLQKIYAAPLPAEAALPIHQLLHFYRAGLEETQFGYRINTDGSGYLAHYLHIPDLTMAQLGWWFRWHMERPATVPLEAGNLKYKIWCPADHWDHRYANGTDDTDGSIMVESLDLGAGGPIFRSLTKAIDPAAVGIPADLLDDFKKRGVVLQLTYEHSEDVVDRIFTAVMQAHPEEGVILMSRVWWGYKYQDGQFVRDNDPNKLLCTEEILRNNLLHSSYEFNHLRKLLPLLQADLHQI